MTRNDELAPPHAIAARLPSERGLAASTTRLICPPAHATKIGDAYYVIPISRDYCAGDDGTPPAH